MRIDQWTPALHRGDAIGDSTLLMCAAFRRWGYESDVYALDGDEDLKDEARPFSAWAPGGAEDIVILHYALPSPLTQALRSQRSKRLLIHHNITPPEFFAGHDPEMVRICGLGRQQLQELAGETELALGDSEFNRRELEAAGFGRTGVLPIYLDFSRYRQAPSPVVCHQLRETGTTNVLFVGRIAPNKRPDDLVRFASYWKKFIAPDIRLLLVGKLPKKRGYFNALQALAYERGFGPQEVIFTGHVPHDDLLAYYRSSDLFLSMSEHEGFGVPLVEAMLLDLPILAYRTTAIPDTLGPAGVQFNEKRFELVAELARELVTNQALRAKVIEGQRKRVADFAPDQVEATLRRHIDSVS
jgi:L-malate glycosyltransferase